MDNYILYIKKGLFFTKDYRQIRTITNSASIWALIGIVPGIVLGKCWLLMAIIMIVVAISAMLITYIVSTKKTSTENQLILQIVAIGNWVIQLSLLQTMVFSMAYGFGIGLLFLHLPTVLIPLLLGLKKSKELKKNKTSTSNNTKSVSKTGAASVDWEKIGLIGAMSGIVGMGLGTLIKHIDQDVAILLFVGIVWLFNLLLSIKFLDIQRLYYFLQLKKQGLFEEETDAN